MKAGSCMTVYRCLISKEIAIFRATENLVTRNSRRPFGVPRWLSSHAIPTSAFPANTESKASQTAFGEAIDRSDNILETLKAATSELSGSGIPTEDEIVSRLQVCRNLAFECANIKPCSAEDQEKDLSPASRLLVLQQSVSKKLKRPILKQHPYPAATSNAGENISRTALAIICHPNVFISRKILALYVETQVALRRPQSFPHAFDLFASKAVPRPGSSPVRYTQPNAKSSKAAIPIDIANSALRAAIRIKDLPLCLNIITTTVATGAFHRAKFLRKALIPSGLLAVSPAMAISLGSAFSNYADRLDPTFAFWCSSLCFMTYFAMVATSGYVAATTAFHSIDRVSWRPGTPLYQRFFREEERDFVDQIARAWGFQDYLKRGQETGEDWENLRGWLMDRSMELDKPELMQHME